jgi:hypothetical protein
MEDKVRVCCLEETFIVGKNRKFDLHFGWLHLLESNCRALPWFCN